MSGIEGKEGNVDSARQARRRRQKEIRSGVVPKLDLIEIKKEKHVKIKQKKEKVKKNNFIYN